MNVEEESVVDDGMNRIMLSSEFYYLILCVLNLVMCIFHAVFCIMLSKAQGFDPSEPKTGQMQRLMVFVYLAQLFAFFLVIFQVVGSLMIWMGYSREMGNSHPVAIGMKEYWWAILLHGFFHFETIIMWLGLYWGTLTMYRQYVIAWAKYEEMESNNLSTDQTRPNLTIGDKLVTEEKAVSNFKIEDESN